jgi:RNA polymerase sigma-70 factor (ECF subfamily)
MLRFQRGDVSAFGELAQRHKLALFNFLLRQLRSRHLAEDALQDVFVRIVQSAAEFKHEARFTTWAFAIARNLCIDQMRKLSLRNHDSLDQGKSGDGPALGGQVADRGADASVERTAMSNELRVRIAEAVEMLPDEQREVFLLREIADLPFKDIAAITGISENTVKSRMRYALERLQEALTEYEDVARALR